MWWRQIQEKIITRAQHATDLFHTSIKYLLLHPFLVAFYLWTPFYRPFASRCGFHCINITWIVAGSVFWRFLNYLVHCWTSAATLFDSPCTYVHVKSFQVCCQFTVRCRSHEVQMITCLFAIKQCLFPFKYTGKWVINKYLRSCTLSAGAVKFILSAKCTFNTTYCSYRWRYRVVEWNETGIVCVC